MKRPKFTERSPSQSPPRMRRNFTISAEVNDLLNWLAERDNRSASNMLEKMILEEWAEIAPKKYHAKTLRV